MDKVESVLSRVVMFNGIKDIPEALHKLSGIMHFHEYDKGKSLIVEGEFGDETFILIEGQVSVFKRTPDGDNYKVVILTSENTPTFGEGALIEAEARSATVVCDVPCKCLVMNRKEFHDFTSQNPAWAEPVLRQIAVTLMGRLRQTSTDMMLLYKALIKEIRSV